MVADVFTGFPQQPYIVLGALQSPGVATVRGLNSPRNWNVQQGWGFTGATAVYGGKGLAEFEVDIDLWEPEHFIEWNLFAQILAPPLPGPAGLALGILHPIVNGPPHGVHAVVVKDVSQPVQSDTGLWTYTLKFLEYRKPIPALARPIAAIPAVGVPGPTAQNLADAELVAKGAQFAALGKL